MQKKMQNNDGFHAGHFLRDLLQEEGHDLAWLAVRIGNDETALEKLLDQPNMDAELFVRLGLPLEPLFMQRMDELVLGQPLEDENQK